MTREGALTPGRGATVTWGPELVAETSAPSQGQTQQHELAGGMPSRSISSGRV